MLTRRDLVLGGAVGAFSSSAVQPVFAQDDSAGREAMQILNGIKPSIERLAALASSNSLALGYVPALRDAFTKYLKANGKFPDYCEVGIDVFYDIYDWHIKNHLAPEIGRVLENRLSIKLMFTQLVVRYELNGNHVGIPFDRI
jgi:hypothetical protein